MAFVEVTVNGKPEKVFASAIAIEQLIFQGNKEDAQRVADAYASEALADLQRRYELDLKYISNQVTSLGLRMRW